MGKLKCNWYFTHDQHCTMQKPMVVKGSTKGKLTKSNYTSSYNLICFLVESCCPVAEVENTKANNFIAVPNDSNLMDNVQTISQAISIIDWWLEGNTEDNRLLTTDGSIVEDHWVDLQLLLGVADKDSEDDTRSYQNRQPCPFKPRSRKCERSRSMLMVSSKPSAFFSDCVAPSLDSHQSSQ